VVEAVIVAWAAVQKNFQVFLGYNLLLLDIVLWVFAVMSWESKVAAVDVVVFPWNRERMEIDLVESDSHRH
jgi:hypothetical protein